MSNKQGQPVDGWISRIWESYRNQDFDISASICEEALDSFPSDPRLLEVAGIIAFERGDQATAVDYISQAMFEISLSFASQMVMAKALLKLDRADEAATTLEFLAEMVQQLPCAMLPDLTHALAKIDREDLALATCRAAFERHPEDDNAAFGVAFYMHRCGYPGELVKNVIAKAIDLNPESKLYRVNMAVVCSSLNQWLEAYQHFTRVPAASLQTLPCECMARQLLELAERFNDFDRINALRK